MEHHFRRAIANVSRYGDTDIFPLPVENHIFYDCPDETTKLLSELHANFDAWLAQHPPAHDGTLAPVTYTGFRWATQLDPLWNLYFLALVLSIAEQVEAQRIDPSEGCVFSYRYKWDDRDATLFDPGYNWRRFMEHSLSKAADHPFVVLCDVSEFYHRLGHHRLENALAHLNDKSDTPWRIMEFLKNFSGTNSFGLPVGGPAARILSELTLNQIDQILKLEGVPFCRYSDDFHIFADSIENGYTKLLLITEKLQRTQGLQLQKAKTRIMSSSEFIATSPIKLDDVADAKAGSGWSSASERARSLLRFSIKFDPYSPTKTDD